MRSCLSVDVLTLFREGAVSDASWPPLPEATAIAGMSLVAMRRKSPNERGMYPVIRLPPVTIWPTWAKPLVSRFMDGLLLRRDGLCAQPFLLHEQPGIAPTGNVHDLTGHVGVGEGVLDRAQHPSI